eukprot:gnl/MRDRNA2_/MRDRNA2_132200_c0_seq1.p1 gnl/MRDRNA2_/MRDRNA2_132200_c0~~gnl/MRDRNA2_/MRDRNA2_132200_c0_seq1.p1  ORF type:complete len:946 (+),score=236.76 gnl/MRDRNA2_/MRDRNA2_132200_c0_seq1:63-2840(+)
MPPTLLKDAVNNSAGVAAAAPEDVAKEHISYIEHFTWKERSIEFCEATDPAGNLESNSSGGYTEYQNRLRAIALHNDGKSKAEIASALGKSVKFVEKWWKMDPKIVPRPPGVHDYLKTEFWRDIEIIRGFGKGLGIYDDVVPSQEWVQPMADGAAFRDGGYRLKYDKEGRMRPQGNQNAKDGLASGKWAQVDKLVQKMLVSQGIDDRVLKRPGLLWYPDGNADAIPHRHEAWTALMSFGAPRILTIDTQPVLLRDGDLIVFGTQRHGVPKMRFEDGTFNDYGGRISMVFFFMPTGQQANGSEPWKAIMDDAPSRKMTAMVKDRDLGAPAELAALQAGPKGPEIKHLTDLGFSAEEAAAALKATAFNLEHAAEVLLNGCGPALLTNLGDNREGQSFGPSRQEQITALYRRLEELQQARRTQNSGSSSESKSGTADDENLALQMSLNCDICSGGGGVVSIDWEETAVLTQLQELESCNDVQTDTEALKRQFAQYDEMLDAKDAEEWDGRGDLMVREWRRQHLNIEQVDPATLYAVGCGNLREATFFEVLQLHSIRVLYDFRANPEATPGKHFVPRSLEVACKARGMVYRHIPLGRETAYGILKHLREDEGRNSLAEVVWHAQRKRTAFLGAEEDWRIDHRAAIAMRLWDAGHKVLHVQTDGGLEEHPDDMEIPDFICTEEERLRKLEKQRIAGELRKNHKSAASRSTEEVAKRLDQPQKEIDVGAELRKANTQAELCRIQRRLANIHRRVEDSSDAKAGLGPKLLNVTKWVQAEASQQRENLAAGKTKDGKEKGKQTVLPASDVWSGSGGTSGGNPNFSKSSCEAAAQSSNAASRSDAVSSDDVTIMVECLGCETQFPWDALQNGDGRCAACCLSATPNPGDSGGAADVQCEPSQEADKVVMNAESAPPRRSTWRSRRRNERAAGDL